MDLFARIDDRLHPVIPVGAHFRVPLSDVEVWVAAMRGSTWVHHGRSMGRIESIDRIEEGKGEAIVRMRWFS